MYDDVWWSLFFLFVQSLCLRQNLIKKIEGLSCVPTLTDLDLYDNQITKIENLEALVNLEWVIFVNYNLLQGINVIATQVTWVETDYTL